MSSEKSLETAQLALTDFDLHLVQDFPHLLIRNSKFLANLEAYATGKLSILGPLLDFLF